MSNFKEILGSLDRVEAICAAVEFDQLRALVAAIGDASSDPHCSVDERANARSQTLILLQDRLTQLLEELSMANTLLQIRRLQLTSVGIDRTVH
jgi:hypothetical protein